MQTKTNKRPVNLVKIRLKDPLQFTTVFMKTYRLILKVDVIGTSCLFIYFTIIIIIIIFIHIYLISSDFSPGKCSRGGLASTLSGPLWRSRDQWSPAAPV